MYNIEALIEVLGTKRIRGAWDRTFEIRLQGSFGSHLIIEFKRKSSVPNTFRATGNRPLLSAETLAPAPPV
jgi:hypothetical protein